MTYVFIIFEFPEKTFPSNFSPSKGKSSPVDNFEENFVGVGSTSFLLISKFHSYPETSF